MVDFVFAATAKREGHAPSKVTEPEWYDCIPAQEHCSAKPHW